MVQTTENTVLDQRPSSDIRPQELGIRVRPQQLPYISQMGDAAETPKEQSCF